MEELWQAAWEERPRLLRTARRRCRNRADAEEVVAEAILRCVTHPNVDPARLPSMLTATVMRLCVDTLRQRVVAERNAHRLFTRPADQTDGVLDRAEAVWLAAEMARLADSERAALTARMLGLTVAETAEALGVTYRAAEGLLGRARRKMRGVWAHTLTLLWPRRRGSWFFFATVGALAVAAGPARTPASVPALAVSRAQAVPADGSESLVASGSGPVRPVRPAARPHHAASVSHDGPTLVTPDVRVGPVRAHPSAVTTDLTDPVGRAEQCARRGVKVVLSEQSVQIVCK